MSKRHYSITPDLAYRCLKCLEEFSNYGEFTKHCGRGGTCVHPITLGLTIDIEISPHRWTSKRTLKKKAKRIPRAV